MNVAFYLSNAMEYYYYDAKPHFGYHNNLKKKIILVHGVSRLWIMNMGSSTSRVVATTNRYSILSALDVL